jgi:predicted CopG family antitoxin
MPKTITLRVADEVYEKFAAAAKAERRPLANLIETLALRKLDEDIFVDQIEMDEILADSELMRRLERGTSQAGKQQGSFVE